MRRVRGLLGVTASALLVASGCSSSDDANVIASGDTAEAVVTAALDAALSGSGRVQMRIDVDDAAMQSLIEQMTEQSEELSRELGEDVEEPELWGPEDLEAELLLEFDGEDFSLSEPGADPPAILQVDGRGFQSVAAMAAWQRDLYVGMSEDETFGALEGPQVPEGVEWVSVDPDDGWYPVGTGWSLSSVDEGPHLIRSEHLRDVVDAGPSEVDGTPTHRYTASLDDAAIAEMHDLEEPEEGSDEDPAEPSGEDAALEDEYDARLSAVEDYLWEHLSVEVSIHLDGDGRLVRTEVANSMDVGEHAACFLLAMSAMPVTMTADYSDLGAELDLAAPPSATVISRTEYEELENESFEDWMGSDLEGIGDLPIGPSDRAWGPDGEPIELVTADGERYRADIEDDLVKFGSVIDLDPATVGDLEDGALVDAHDRASAALAALPTTTTALGDLTRVELLWNVKWGMENFGLDPAAADAMDDRALGALIDGFVGEQGVSGDGIWGDGPTSMAELESADWFEEESSSDLPASEHEAEDLFAFDQMFAGCPS